MSYTVTFRSNNGSITTLTLYSHYTCIYGDDSGEGKSYFFSLIEERITRGNITVEVSDGLHFTTANEGSLEAILRLPETHVVMIDELTMLQTNLIDKVNKSKHLFITINRGMALRLNYPLKGIYKIDYAVINGEDSFEFLPVSGLKLLNQEFLRTPIDYIITESEGDRSEHELLSVYISNLLASSGQNKIYRQIKSRLTDRILVLADLCAIGCAYDMLCRVVEKSDNVVFYPYDCFEQLLLESNLVRKYQNNIARESEFNYFSLEAFYEDILEKETKGTDIEYLHGKPLSSEYLNRSNFEEIFKTSVGMLLWEYLRRQPLVNIVIHGAINIYFEINKSGVYLVRFPTKVSQVNLVRVLNDYIRLHPKSKVALISPSYNDGGVVGDIARATYVFIDRLDLLLIKNKYGDEFLLWLSDLGKYKCILVDFNNFSSYNFYVNFSKVEVYSDSVRFLDN